MCFSSIAFIFSSSRDRDFSGISQLIPTNFDEARRRIKAMKTEDLYAFQEYADKGTKMWVTAELQRRDFILKQWSMGISVLALIISGLAIYLKAD